MRSRDVGMKNPLVIVWAMRTAAGFIANEDRSCAREKARFRGFYEEKDGFQPQKKAPVDGAFRVAGAGFEPATSGL
jgi:hypothetical protein